MLIEILQISRNQDSNHKLILHKRCGSLEALFLIVVTVDDGRRFSVHNRVVAVTAIRSIRL